MWWKSASHARLGASRHSGGQDRSGRVSQQVVARRVVLLVGAPGYRIPDAGHQTRYQEERGKREKPGPRPYSTAEEARVGRASLHHTTRVTGRGGMWLCQTAKQPGKVRSREPLWAEQNDVASHLHLLVLLCLGQGFTSPTGGGCCAPIFVRSRQAGRQATDRPDTQEGFSAV